MLMASFVVMFASCDDRTRLGKLLEMLLLAGDATGVPIFHAEAAAEAAAEAGIKIMSACEVLRWRKLVYLFVTYLCDTSE